MFVAVVIASLFFFAAIVTPSTYTAQGDMHTLATNDQTVRRRVDSSPTPTTPLHVSDDSNTPDSHFVPRSNHTPVIDSLIPFVQSNESATPSNHKQLITAVACVISFVGLCTIVAVVFFLVRYFMRRAAIKRRRQASWILRSGQWNMEPKRTEVHETRAGFSDTSSLFSAYPYPLSEHF